MKSSPVYPVKGGRGLSSAKFELFPDGCIEEDVLDSKLSNMSRDEFFCDSESLDNESKSLSDKSNLCPSNKKSWLFAPAWAFQLKLKLLTSTESFCELIVFVELQNTMFLSLAVLSGGLGLRL